MRLAALLVLGACLPLGAQDVPVAPRIERLVDGPIIRPDMLPGDDGENINGPSLIRVPAWVEEPLGAYYLYFAHHQGTYIRLAYADRLTGPWTVHEAGTLRIEDTVCDSVPESEVSYKHVASPDVLVDGDARQITMYFHCHVYVSGPREEGGSYRQMSLAATSADGLHFEALSAPLGRSYFRGFRWDGAHYALGMPGVLYRSKDGLGDFAEGPTLFTRDMRHSALKLDGDLLHVFFTVVGENPERILLSQLELTGDWMSWKESESVVVLEPERSWEGADLPAEPSARGAALSPVRQLRDPAIYEEDGRTYLLYTVAGEQGIAIAEVHW